MFKSILYTQYTGWQVVSVLTFYELTQGICDQIVSW